MNQKLIELGSFYVSNFIENSEDSEAYTKYPLDLYLDSSIGAPRLPSGLIAPPNVMWGNYWYRSGTNETMTKHLGSVVNEIISRIKTEKDDIWLDIACNDGTLLRQVPDSYIKAGIDPCEDSYYEESSKYAKVVKDYFSKKAWDKLGFGIQKKAKIITCISMFYDLDDPHNFINDIHDILDPNGLLVLQMSYTPLMIQQMAFDNICHEHVYYYSLSSLTKLFEAHDFTIVDANLNDCNGGSVRLYLTKKTSNQEFFGTKQFIQVCSFRKNAILSLEEKIDISNIDTWKKFSYDLEKLKQQVLDFFKQAKKENKVVYGYGASTKGNTLLQYFGLSNKDIIGIAERSPHKYGKKTIGSEIPIISEEEMREVNPDYLFVLPWHFIDEFILRESEWLKNGGCFVVPCPEFKLIRN
jgi:SAM-dependent methyltransferase